LAAQLALGASVAGQLSVSPKSVEAAMLPIDSAAPPVFVIVTARGALVVPTVTEPNESVVGSRPTDGTAIGVAEPVSVTVSGAAGPSSSKPSVAALSPAVCGAKTTSTVQLPPAGTPPLRSHVVVRVKSAAFAPVTPIDDSESGALPELVRVTVCAALWSCTWTAPKVSPPGARLACGVSTPVPLRATVCGPDAASSPIVSVADRVPAPCGLKET
jgi:hypothetical protein